MTPAATRSCEHGRQSIPAAPLVKVPDARPCVPGKAYESAHDPRPHIEEGIAGSREDCTRIRGKQWSEMVQRSDIGRSLRLERLQGI